MKIALLLSTVLALESFDELFVGHPTEIEKNLQELLPKAQENRSIRLQILSQIALAQAMQKRFTEAHALLDDAEKDLLPEDRLARARILLERGRVLWQEGKMDGVQELFEASYALSQESGYHICNAAHMVAIVAENPEEKIVWNEKAIAIAESSEDTRTRAWLGSLHNNLGVAYLEAKEYEKALATFQKGKLLWTEEVHRLGADWQIARALRHLHRVEEALAVLLRLREEYEKRSDIPTTSRGLVYAELAEIFAAKAYADLSQDEWMQRLEMDKLKRMEKWSQ